MSVAIVTRTCLTWSWCIADHDAEGDSLHYQVPTVVPVADDTVNVYAFIHRGRRVVCIEDIEMSPAQARKLAARLVAEADLVEAGVR